MRFSYRILLLLVAITNIQQVQACDVCGCTVSTQSLGLLPQFSKHFLGVQYLYSSSKSQHPSLFSGKEDEHSSQSYTTVQAWGRYQFTKNIQVFAFVPYLYNINREATGKTSSNGIGDATLMANISLPLGKNKNSSRLLLAGAGIKAPTGTYTGISNAERNGLPNIQSGTGSWDFLINANYTQKQTRWGYNADLNYSITSANKEQYKFGNRLNAAVMAFYWAEKKAFTIVPQAGLRAEYSLHDYDHYGKKWLNEKTGGTIGFLSAGSQLYYKTIGLKAMVHLPLYQHFAAGYVEAGLRFESGIFILF